MRVVFKSALIVLILFLLSGCDFIRDYKYRHYKGKFVREISEDLFKKIKSGQFEEVESYFDYLIERQPFTNNGTRLLEEIYSTISERGGVKKVLDDWCKSSDKHHSAYLLTGLFYIQDAWRARGGDWGYTVTDEGRRLFRDRLLLAKKNLEMAYHKNPKDPNSAGALIAVFKGLKIGRNEMEDWFRLAVEADLQGKGKRISCCCCPG